MYSMITIVNNNVYCKWFKRVDTRFSHHTHVCTHTHEVTMRRDGYVNLNTESFHYEYQNIMLYILNRNNFYFKNFKKLLKFL